MKKLKLSLANMQGAEMLTREQLKKVVGGESGSGNGCPDGEVPCTCISDTTTFEGCAAPTECWNKC